MSTLLIKTQNLKREVDILKNVLQSHCDMKISVKEHNSSLQNRVLKLKKIIRGFRNSRTSVQNPTVSLNIKKLYFPLLFRNCI